jgi:hypothetical protein
VYGGVGLLTAGGDARVGNAEMKSPAFGYMFDAEIGKEWRVSRHACVGLALHASHAWVSDFDIFGPRPDSLRALTTGLQLTGRFD